MSKIKKSTSLAAFALVGMLAVSGCSTSDEPAEGADQAPVEENEESAESAEPEDSEDVDEPENADQDQEADQNEDAEQASASSGNTPVWFEGSLDAGEKIAEGATDSWDIQVFQVGTGEMDKDSTFVDADTNENLLPAGTEVVYLNFVYTNTSSAAVPLAMIPDPRVRSVNFPYLAGQPGVVTPSLYEEFGISSFGFDATKIEGEYDDPLVVEPGQSVAIATSIEYEPGVDAEAKPRFIAKDDNGDLMHDDAEEVTIVFTIK